MLNKLFVYGTLRKGCCNHRILENMNADFEYRCMISGYAIYEMGQLPYALREGLHSMVIDVFALPAPVSQIGSLDVFEGHPSLYRRVKVNNGKEDGWLYEGVDITRVSRPYKIHFDWRKHEERLARA